MSRGLPESVVLAHYLRPTQIPNGVADWATTTLEALASRDPALARPAGRARAGEPIDQADAERVAVALARYLALSGDYTYTSRLTRADKKADPVEEFLTRTKSGHCQRYAAGLVLALRSLGVPSQYVLGFKGWDADPQDPESIVIRQEHAHAWAEVLVTRPAPGGVTWHWLSVDPTPGGVEAEANPGSWLDTASDQGRAFFLDFIVGYNPDRRQKAVAALIAWFTRAGWQWLAGFVVLAAASLMAPRVRRRFRLATPLPARPTTGVEGYDRFRAAMASVNVEPLPGETPSEFARRASVWLGERDPSLVELPLEVTAAMQRERYAGLPPEPGDAARLTAMLERAKLALQAQRD